MAKSRNRGKESKDDLLFGTVKAKTKLKEAVKDMSYLLSRGYGERSSLQLVGNRYRLNVRQQKALQGMTASEEQLERRKSTHFFKEELKHKVIAIDGFNLLIIIESALSGAYLFKGQDGCYRDLSSVHGTYKRVVQTERALKLIGNTLESLEVEKVLWILDRPVSNSGRLKQLMLEIAAQYDYNWSVLLDYNPDKLLAMSNDVVVSSDAWVLDRANQWFNLVAYMLKQSGIEFFEVSN